MCCKKFHISKVDRDITRILDAPRCWTSQGWKEDAPRIPEQQLCVLMTSKQCSSWNKGQKVLTHLHNCVEDVHTHPSAYSERNYCLLINNSQNSIVCSWERIWNIFVMVFVYVYSHIVSNASDTTSVVYIILSTELVQWTVTVLPITTQNTFYAAAFRHIVEKSRLLGGSLQFQENSCWFRRITS